MGPKRNLSAKTYLHFIRVHPNQARNLQWKNIRIVTSMKKKPDHIMCPKLTLIFLPVLTLTIKSPLRITPS
jgi:hypothetical protein